MKAIGIDALKLDDDLNIIRKESTLIKALINPNGELVYENIVEIDSKEKIRNYDDIENFLEIILQTAKSEFGNDFNVYEISGIDEEDNYLWTIKCTFDEEMFAYVFMDNLSTTKFEETLVKSNKESVQSTEDATGNIIFRNNFGTSKNIISNK